MPTVNVRLNSREKRLLENRSGSRPVGGSARHVRAGLTFLMSKAHFTPWQEGVEVTDEQLAQLQADPLIEVAVVE